MSKDHQTSFLENDALPPKSATAEQPFRLDIRRALQMHGKLALAVALAVAAAIIVFALLLRTQYQSTAIFSVSPVVTNLLPVNGANGSVDVSQFDSSVQQDVETLSRADVVTAALRSLPEGVWQQPGEPEQAAIRRLQSALSVSRVGNSLQISATLTGSDRDSTARTLSAVAASFLKTVHRDEDGHATERIDLLRREESRLDGELDRTRADAAELSASFGVGRLGDNDRTSLDQNVVDLRAELADLRRARAFAAAGIASQGSGSGSGEESNGNTTTSGLVLQINSRKAQLESQMAGMTPANPLYKQDQAELRSLDTELLSATGRGDTEQLNRLDRLRDREVEGATREQARVEQQLAATSAAAVRLAGNLQRYSALTGQITALQTRLNTLREAIAATSLQANSPSRITLAVAPSTDTVAVASKRRIALLVAIPAGLLLGLLVAILARRQDRRVFLAVDLEGALGMRPMTVLAAPAQVSDQLADQAVLRLAASIESALLRQRSRTFVFTAASPGTAVEELVFRVQTKLRALGYNALWLGAETLQRAERDFEEKYGRGPANDRNLRFSEAEIPTGEVQRESTAVRRLNWLKGEYDLVLIDAPPLLASAEAEYAVRRTDATILVVESGTTTRDELSSCAALLEQLGAARIGAVLQDLRLQFASPADRDLLRKAEFLASHPSDRNPVDGDGEWRILPNAGVDSGAGGVLTPRVVTPMRPRSSRTGLSTWVSADAQPERQAEYTTAAEG